MRLWSTVVNQLQIPVVGYSLLVLAAYWGAATVVAIAIESVRLLESLQIRHDVGDLLIRKHLHRAYAWRSRIDVFLAQRHHLGAGFHHRRVLDPSGQMLRIIRIKPG